MIFTYEKDDSKEIIDYIGDEYYKSLYLYLNYLKYSIKDNEINLYVQIIDNCIRCLLLNYGNTVHVFSKENDYDVNEICEFITKNNYSVICADENIISEISKRLEEKKYIESFGNIWEMKKLNDFSFEHEKKVEVALENEFEKIVEFLLEDKRKKNIYTKDNLYNQIINRNKEKYGRNYIIKEKDNIIAHAGTGAENSCIAVINFVMVDEKYRGNGYASSIVKKLCEDLISENKICYLMTVSSDVENLYKKIGFYKKWTYGKLVRR